MFRHLSKVAIVLFLLVSQVTLSSHADFLLVAIKDLIQGQGKIVDLVYLAQQNKNVVDNFGIAPKVAEAAVSSAEAEYKISIGPVNGSTASGYVYGSMLNPSGSGKTIVIKRILTRSNAVAGTNYVNLTVRRTTAASAGTQISATDIPKKNTASANSVAEIRHTGVSVTYSGAVQARLLGQPMAGTAGVEYSVREIVFGADDEKLILKPGEGLALYQEAAGFASQRVSMQIEWEEVSSAPAAGNEYMLAIQRVEVAATANYVYNSFFNPVGSGRTALVKRVWFGTETCDTTALYQNIQLRRISAASGGSLIAAADVPKKNTSSPNSVMQARYTAVTVTQVGGVPARLGMVTPCGAVAQETGWQQYNFHSTDEPLVLQPGQGLALISEAAGDIDQLVRMFVEWEEVVSTPTAENEYLWASDRVTIAAALGTNFYTVFNPSGSGRTAEVKRLVIRVNASAAATYSTFNFQRISAASGGTLIAAADIPKKNTNSGNSIMEIRWCGATCATAITPTYVGARSIAASGMSDSGIMKALGPAAIGQAHGQQELIFTPEEPLILKAGEGVGMYLNYLAGSLAHSVKISAEWGEVSTEPTAQNQYLIDIGAMSGNAGASYNYTTFFNPAGSGKAAVIKRTALRVNAVNTASYTPIQVKRISAASGGTQITSTNIPKKHTSSANSVMDIRHTGVTATYTQGTDAQLLGVVTPGLGAAVTAMSKNAWRSLYFENDEEIVLQPGEGIVLNNNAAGNTNHRLYWYLEWEEKDLVNIPPSQNEYMMTTYVSPGSTAANHVYATIFNPSTSGKLYLIKRLGIRGNRTGTLVAPGYIPISLRPVTAASGGTLVTSANIPKKHSSSAAPTAEIRRSGVTATFGLGATSRLLSVISPGAVRQSHSVTEQGHIAGDEYVLSPGEGIALYQEVVAGDTLVNYMLTVGWQEINIPEPPYISFSISDNQIGFGNLSSGSSRYATGDTLGTGVISTTAHTIAAETNAAGGYIITLNGNTLTAGGNTISPIGSTALSPAIGFEQFGVSMNVASGTGAVSAPYSTANQYAFATSSFPDVIATGTGDGVETLYGASYVSNIAASTAAGSYSATVTYVITGTF